MSSFNLKNHNEKVLTFTKKVASGGYPSPKIAKIGSYIGSAIGMVLALIGGFGIIIGGIWGLGSLLAGIVTIVSNIINLKRVGKAVKMQ